MSCRPGSNLWSASSLAVRLLAIYFLPQSSSFLCRREALIRAAESCWRGEKTKSVQQPAQCPECTVPFFASSPTVLSWSSEHPDQAAERVQEPLGAGSFSQSLSKFPGCIKCHFILLLRNLRMASNQPTIWGRIRPRPLDQTCSCMKVPVIDPDSECCR